MQALQLQSWMVTGLALRLLGLSRALSTKLLNGVAVLLCASDNVLFVEPDEKTVAVMRYVNGKQVTKEIIGCDDLQQLAATEVVQAHVKRSPSRVILVLKACQAVHRNMTLPAVARSSLRSAAELQVDLETPFRLKDVYVSVLQVRDRWLKGRISVELAALPKSHVAKNLMRCGLSHADDVTVRLRESPGKISNHTFSIRENAGARRWRQRSALLLALIAAIELAMAAVLPAIFYQQAIENLEARGLEMSKSADEIDLLYKRAVARQEVQRGVMAEKRSRIPLTSLLQDLLKYSPKRTRYDQASFYPDHIRLVGTTKATADLVEALNQGAHFTDVTYVSPSMPMGENNEHFDLGFKIKLGD
jgi:hypothetical protein